MTIQKNSQLNILIIDDDEFLLELVTMSLKKQGFKSITTVTNGRLALDKLDDPNLNFNLLICDLNMPEMDGVELLRHLSARHFSEDIILFSGEDKKILSIANKIAKERHLNVLGTLSKPFEISQFMALLATKKETKAKPAAANKADKFEPTISDLEKGLDRNEFILYYQPQINIKAKKLIGFEALIRWNHPEYGVLGPYKFIDFAEKNNLIGPLTDQTIVGAIKKAKEWQSLSPGLRVSYNLSALLLTRLDLPEFIESHVKAEQLDTKCFMIEITESQLIKHWAEALEVLTRLSLKRFGISIDDFGTGYSSMKQLQEIHFTELKIDQAFVHQSSQKPTAKAILESSVQLAKSLNIETVAEGVETQDDWNQVEKAGCDIAQGYFVSKPIAPENVPSWIENCDWIK